jgi:hypothetical protein
MTDRPPDSREIDLGAYSSDESIVLSGRPKGENVRKQLGLDAMPLRQRRDTD